MVRLLNRRFLQIATAILLVIVLLVVIIFLRQRASQGIRSERPAAVPSVPSEKRASSTVATSSSEMTSIVTTGTSLEFIAPPKKEAPRRSVPTINAEEAVPSSSSSASTLDSDEDGLHDVDEARYGTDPSKRDTDGDTYPDGEEVEKGYNPLGQGTCAVPTCVLQAP